MVKWMIPLLFWLQSNFHIDVDGAKILKNQNYPKGDSTLVLEIAYFPH
jgi:hypothetical protein